MSDTDENFTENLTEKLSSLLNDPEAIKEAAADAAKNVAGYVKKNPYKSIGITFAVGVIAGMFLAKKNKSS
jgi:ElaB/YqjD/DUF883 family membrane-anchored ribosome-binding protein